MTASANQAQGLQSLTEVLAGQTSAVAGPSGVGKSSLINALSIISHLQTDSHSASPAAVVPGGDEVATGPLDLHHTHELTGKHPAELMQPSSSASTSSSWDDTIQAASLPEAQDASQTSRRGGLGQALSDASGIHGQDSSGSRNSNCSSTTTSSSSSNGTEGAHSFAHAGSAPAGSDGSSIEADANEPTNHDSTTKSQGDEALHAYFQQQEPRSQLELAQSRANLQGIGDTGGTMGDLLS